MLKLVDWTKVNGLLPAIIQDASNGTVLMLGYMDPEALEMTLKDGLVTFYSRTRQCLWRKGQNSGHYLKVKQCLLDCDRDTLLVTVEHPTTPICHRDTKTCFDQEETS